MKKLYHQLEQLESKTPVWGRVLILLALTGILGWFVYLNIKL